MGFLAPWYFALAAAAAVPLLLHLLRRRIATRVDFPAVRYLARAEQEQSARLRLRNWLLMALRVLAVLLIALAAARPVSRAGGAGHVPTAAAIVLDNSLSTTAVVGGRPVLDALRQAALAVAAAASTDDRLWLVTADGRVTGGSPRAIAEAIGRVSALAGAGDPARASARAAEVVHAAGLPSASVVVLTDGQASAWHAAAELHDVRVVLHVPSGAPPHNRAVLAATARPVRWTPGGAVVTRVSAADSATFRVTELGAGVQRTLARGTAPPDGELTIHVAPVARGWIAGSVAVEPDELRGDDQRFFAAFAGPPPAAVADPSAGPFVGSALATLVQSGRASTGGGRVAQLVAADAATRLPALIIAPSDPSRLGPANQALERLGIPWRFGAVRFGESALRIAALSGDSSRAGSTVTRRYQLLPRGSAPSDTLAVAGGEPWIVSGRDWVLVASPLVAQATSFPVRAAFVPWLGAMLAERLAGDAGDVVEATPGALVARPQGVAAMLGADGRRIALPDGAVAAPDRPGVYFWLRNGARSGALVVNVEVEESKLVRLSARELAGRFGGASTRVADGAAIADAAFGGEGRRPVSGPVLAVALLALCAEGAVTRRSRSAAGPGPRPAGRDA